MIKPAAVMLIIILLGAASVNADRLLKMTWTELKNPVLQYPDRSIKDYACAYKDGTFYLFFSAFYEDNGRVRSHVVEVTTKDFKTYSKPVFNIDGQSEEWIGLCSPDILKVGDTYILVFNSWGDKKDKPNQLFYMTSKDLINWSTKKPLAENLTKGQRAIDASLAYNNNRFYLFFKQSRDPQVTRCCTAGSLDDDFTYVGDGLPKTFDKDGKEFAWNENYQFVKHNGKWMMIASTHSREDGKMMPIIYTMGGSGNKDTDWLKWINGYRPEVAEENFNTDHKANSAAICIGNVPDNYTYLLYAGRTEGESYLRRGWNKLGLSRTKDMIKWHPAGE